MGQATSNPSGITEIGKGCGWFEKPATFQVHGTLRLGSEVGVWVYQPYLPIGSFQRWLGVSEQPGSQGIGRCQIQVDMTATAFFEFKTANTAAYFPIPYNSALIGRAFYLQAMVRVGGRTDLSRGLRIVVR